MFQLPQESFGQYDVTERLVTIPVGGALTPVAPLDPNRVVIVLSLLTSGGLINITIGSLVPAGDVGQINSTLSYFLLSHALVGPLVSQAFFGANNGAGSADVLVWEVFLRRRPEEDVPPKPIEVKTRERIE